MQFLLRTRTAVKKGVCVCVWEVVFSPVNNNNNLPLFTGHFFPLPLLPKSVLACFTGDIRFPLEVRCQFELHLEALQTKRLLKCWERERELPLSILPAFGVSLWRAVGSEMHWERARGSVPGRVFFPWGTLEEFCLYLYPLSGKNKCTLLCVSLNWVLLTTYISSSGAVCFCVLLIPVVLQWLWIFLPLVVWSRVAEDCVCV